jgi:hypothetical protein
MIEGQLKCLAESDDIKLIVSENERICKKNSYAIMKVCYDPDHDGHTYRGKIKIKNPHPANVVFQKNCYRIKDMNHMWHIENRSIDDVCLEYGEEFRDQLETDGAEYSYLEDFSATTYRESTAKSMVSVVECWYKDKDGDVNVVTWCNDIMLAHKKKFFYKKDLVERDGKFYETVMQEQYDEAGTLVGYQPIEVVAFIPKDFPFVIWYNIPKEKSIRGKADPEIIADQQLAINKVMSNEEERLMKGNTKIIARKNSGLANKINNSITQVLETENPQSDVLVIDMDMGEQKTAGGLIIQSDDGKAHGVKPRWAKVYKVGSEIDFIKEGQWILIEHGRWTRKIKIDDGEGEKEFQKVETKSIIAVANEKPNDFYIGQEFSNGSSLTVNPEDFMPGNLSKIN